MRTIRSLMMAILFVASAHIAQAAKPAQTCWQGTVVGMNSQYGTVNSTFAVVLADGANQKIGYGSYSESWQAAMYLAQLQAQEKLGGAVEICGVPEEPDSRLFRGVSDPLPTMRIRSTRFLTNGTVWSAGLAY